MKKVILISIILLIILGALNGAVSFAQVDNPILNLSSSGNSKLMPEETAFVNLVEKVTPSVVTIAEEHVDRSKLSPDHTAPPLDAGIPPGFEPVPSPTGPQNTASGFIASDNGRIVTSKHAVSEEGTRYTVITNNAKKYTVQKIYKDPANDIAILTINPKDNNGNKLQAVTFGDSDNLRVGQFAIAIGTPLGEYNNTVTTGIISGLGRSLYVGSPQEDKKANLQGVIQTDAAINSGNSGGPLLNSSGQVIGINAAGSGAGQNINFALPANLVQDALKNLD